MTTQILIGNPSNLFVWDYGRYGTGCAPFYGDVEKIRSTWRPVQQNVSVGNSRGTIYAPPEQREVTIIDSR